jgi:hypothetical protein
MSISLRKDFKQSILQGTLRFEMQNAIELPSLAANDSQSSPPAQESSSMITPQPVGQKSVFREDEIEHGKPSVIHSYCQRAIDQGRKECIWLCIQRGRKWIAKDIQLETEDKAFGISELRRMSGWWKQHSMFSTVAVKEIRVRIMSSFLQRFDFFETKSEREY